MGANATTPNLKWALALNRQKPTTQIDGNSTQQKMANESLQKAAELPTEFLQEGAQFVRRCTKPDKKGTRNCKVVGSAKSCV